MHSSPVAIMWFRRDLRLKDNAALYHALTSGLPVVPVFIFDRNILDDLEDKSDRRVEFIHAALMEMQDELLKIGSTMDVRYGFPKEVYAQLLKEYKVQKVYTNHDYEPYAQERDAEVAAIIEGNGGSFHHFKDQVIFEKGEVVKDDGKPYTVFTPYSRRWKATLNEFYLKSYPTEKYFGAFLKQVPRALPSLDSLGFQEVAKPFPSRELDEELVRKYSDQRDIPSIQGTSRLGVHLRFGTISIRELARRAGALNETFLNELIWRDFYHMILANFPQVGKGMAFKPEYDQIKWRNDEGEFRRWCEGTTGYPIVDAGMRELNATGFMHNRVRMIVASFLTKHLLIDWRWGEAYFAKKLLDFDFAANNGGWQWAAGSGCDAAPYFRVFNPYLQTQKFDPKLQYIRQWVPEFEGFGYPKPIVEHDFARKRCLEVYSATLKR
ncbi:DNA photolyase family protein [Flavihumibacter rivuli]|uniref:cryptochrome/photolyase family protein n=1 Tax=Flavihumibacter rivuli TaxID=2838156 RepID=UPI001BDE3A46|nr:deoxyribodipyrimidine photo-lyase [Flavihumibacter rivuli]ULQ56753.1 DNA photolyase family protein [Flavihumibacter rivuli]